MTAAEIVAAVSAAIGPGGELGRAVGRFAVARAAGSPDLPTARLALRRVARAAAVRAGGWKGLADAAGFLDWLGLVRPDADPTAALLSRLMIGMAYFAKTGDSELLEDAAAALAALVIDTDRGT